MGMWFLEKTELDLYQKKAPKKTGF